MYGYLFCFKIGNFIPNLYCNDWYEQVREANWNNPNDVKLTYGNASIIANNRVVFNIKGNEYRLITKIDYKFKFVFIIWVGTHSEYNKIDAITVKYNG